MKVRCTYCNAYISETVDFCPNCGGANQNVKRVGNGVPTTIEELKQWYVDHNLPDPSVTRFFIGEDYKEPCAFGIYQDPFTGNFVVYKNKDTGQRAIRYEGNDEVYAVNELYLKLKEEIQNQKNLNASRRASTFEMSTESSRAFAVFLVALIVGSLSVMAFIMFGLKHLNSHSKYPEQGYYIYDNEIYYNYLSEWYKPSDIDKNEWKYIGSDVNNKLEKKHYKYFITLGNEKDDKIPDSLDFNKSGYYLDFCKLGYYQDYDDNFYYFYDKTYSFYKYENDTWVKIEKKDYDNSNYKVRLKCNYFNNKYDESWGIQNFKDSEHYIADRGYYKYDGKYYYYDNNRWYVFDDYWSIASDIPDHSYNYYYSSDYSAGISASDFSRSEYAPHSSSSSDWDSGSSWSSSDSWDSGGTDWSSDW